MFLTSGSIGILEFQGYGNEFENKLRKCKEYLLSTVESRGIARKISFPLPFLTTFFPLTKDPAF